MSTGQQQPSLEHRVKHKAKHLIAILTNDISVFAERLIFFTHVGTVRIKLKIL